jgi:hypothetical protein
MSTAEVAIGASVAVAFAGYIVTYGSGLRLARRKDQLDRINRQLSDLYGPLYALLQASNRIFAEFGSRHSTPRFSWTREEATEWRTWVTTVFMPLNRQMVHAIVTHADLLIEEVMPDCLHELCAHVAGYEPVLQRWAAENFDAMEPAEHLSILDFPQSIQRYVDTSFAALKRKQTELLDQVT